MSEVNALIDRLVEGASDYVITKDIIDRDGAGEWDDEAVAVARWMILGGLAYLVDLSHRAGVEEDLNVVLNKLVDQIGA